MFIKADWRPDLGRCISACSSSTASPSPQALATATLGASMSVRRGTRCDRRATPSASSSSKLWLLAWLKEASRGLSVSGARSNCTRPGDRCFLGPPFPRPSRGALSWSSTSSSRPRPSSRRCGSAPRSFGCIMVKRPCRLGQTFSQGPGSCRRWRRAPACRGERVSSATVVYMRIASRRFLSSAGCSLT